jgi:hypothetical protein
VHLGVARRIVAALAVLAVALVAMAAPRDASACTSEQPTFEQAMGGAQAVAWVEVVLAADGEVQPGIPPLRVTEVIHGDPAPFLAADPRTGLCGDTIHYLYGDGARVLVAFGVPFFDQVIHPTWWRDETGAVSGTGGVPFGVRTIEGLEAAVRDRFPAPEANDSGPMSIDGSWVVIIAAALATAIGLRILWRRSPQ